MMRLRALAGCVLAAVMMLTAAPSSGSAPAAPRTPIPAVAVAPGGTVSLPVRPETTADLLVAVADQQKSLDAADRAIRETEAGLRALRSGERSAASRAAAVAVEMEKLAVRAYIDAGTVAGASLGLSPVGTRGGTKRVAAVKVLAQRRADVVARLEQSEQRLRTKRRSAERALARASARRREIVERLRELQAALQQHAVMDYQAAARAAADRARRVSSSAGAVGATPVGATPVGATPVGGGLVSVRGIVVAASIANGLQAMLGAADAAGIGLGGDGYRDPAAQRRLREQHCPDPVNSPASACSPPTAPPGHSMHEQGLAIDFTSHGSLISSHGSAAFQWMSANAARFGFSNLPSEPWHWSVNGR